jgi:hypothetical protein
VLADWWFSLALSKGIFQPMQDKGACRRFSGLTQKVVTLSESQLLKGLSDTWVGYHLVCRKPDVTKRALKTF